MSVRVIGRGTWLTGDQGTSLAAITGQLPVSSGTSLPSQPSFVEPLGPEWPSCRHDARSGGADAVVGRGVVLFGEDEAGRAKRPFAVMDAVEVVGDSVDRG